MKIYKRHLAKTVSWRVVGTLDTLFFAWIISGDIDLSIDISIITTFTKMLWYYFHEKIWFKFKTITPNKRHIYKTFSWRFVGTSDTIIFSWIIFGDPSIGLTIGIAEVISKMILYYIHEKIWYRTKYGLNNKSDLNIQ